MGGNQIIHIDVRFISATNRDLNAEIEASRFRRDLYYRLVVADLDIPPLRERGGDLWLLLEHFAGTLGASGLTLDPDVRVILEEHAWPGNVRELENFVRYALAKAPDGHVSLKHLPRNIRQSPSRKQSFSVGTGKTRMLMDAIHANDYNLSKAAKALGISRSTLYRRMRKHLAPEN